MTRDRIDSFMLCQVEMLNVLSVLRFCCIARVIGFDAVLDPSDDVGLTILIRNAFSVWGLHKLFFPPLERFSLQVVYDNLIICNFFHLCFDFCSLCLKLCCIFYTCFFHPRRFGIKKEDIVQCSVKTVCVFFSIDLF